MSAGLSDRYRAVVERVEAAARGRPVTLIAVSKTQPADALETLHRLGHRDFGENYVQELLGKARELAARGCEGIRWHMIGHLQTNKAKALIEQAGAHAVHAVDSPRLAAELARRWRDSRRPGRLAVFAEVNVDREPSKSGVGPEEAVSLASQIAALPELELQGLMCVPAPQADPRAAFARLRELELACRAHGSLGKLSMGMSGDFELALSEGATHVRVGTAIFGPR